MYGEIFGAPEFDIEVVNGKIERIQVVRGAPCDSTWRAAPRVKSMAVKDALAAIGLESQYFCCADPSAWDPISGQSMVHLAAQFHRAALQKAIEKK